ncbi:neuropeptide F receptor-like protein [Leptotrombidium deliense]|uniref:Neuropeptide F receptor-like protein n=1 Tax=Leptotrombidium deliense TaxID=299467 RepID=A0A443SQS6_9ACAR|nr:neuropeptide F receptor-like protein [Leptotrombidium deliense]
MFRVLFACCHLVGMSSACSNPLLYGFLNDNFRKEFKDIFLRCCPACVRCIRRPAISQEGNNETMDLQTLGERQTQPN